MSVFRIKKTASTGSRWVAQIMRNGKRYRCYTDPVTGEVIESKKRAKELELYLIKSAMEERNPKKEKHLVLDCRESFSSYLQKKLKPTSLYSRMGYFDRQILPYFGKMAIEDITNDDLERFNDRINAKMSPGKLNNTIEATRAFIRFAWKVNRTLLPENIFKFKTFAPINHTYHFYTYEEEQRFLDVIEDIRDKLMFTLFCYYGFRITECLALQRGDIDLKNKTISIRRIVQTKTEQGGQYFQSPKTKRSVRTLALVDGIEDLLPPNLKSEDFLFPARQSSPGKVTGEMTVRRLVTHYARKAGLEPIKVHEFRHSCASNLLRKGIPIRIVANWLGDTEGTIMNYYSHVFQEEANVIPSVILETFRPRKNPCNLEAKDHSFNTEIQ
ncbi:MAG: site-specific integrase [Bacilli bacterium]|nr:site-specific integrase [Bacilli bacterium]